jgi:GntR family transcriptional regulator
LAYLPSETQLSTQYGTSRRTVHDAVAQLRREGLVTVINGKGAYVRPATELARHVYNRAVTRAGQAFTDTATEGWTEVEEPSTYRADTPAEIAQLLGVPPRTTLFGCDRLLTDEATSQQRMLHRLYLPWQTVDAVPALEGDPFLRPADLYALLTEAGHKLAWTETVTARMPSPDDANTLRILEGTPMLTTRRTTTDQDGRILALEETRLSAGETQVAYTFASTRPVRVAH